MPIGDSPYPRSVLSDDHWEALYQAQREVIDFVLNDLSDLAVGADFADLAIASYLPRRLLLRYDEGFLRKFLVCLVTVGLKLRLPGYHMLGCTAEETALYVIKQHAAELLGKRGIVADFSTWDDLALEDADHEWLYTSEYDGIEDTAEGQWLGVAHLGYDEWFVPFNPPRTMHPYADRGADAPWQVAEVFAPPEDFEDEEGT